MKRLLNTKVVSIILFLFGAAMMVACGGGGGGGSTSTTDTSVPQLSSPAISPTEWNSSTNYSGFLTVNVTDAGGNILNGTYRYSYGQYLSNPITIQGWIPNATSGTLNATVNIELQYRQTNTTLVTIWVFDTAGNQSNSVTVTLSVP